MGSAPPPPPPPPPLLSKGGSGKSPMSFADAIRQKVIARGGSVDEKSEEKAPPAKALPPPPPPPAKAAVPLSPIGSAMSPTRSRMPTPFPRNVLPNSDESAEKMTPIRRRKPPPSVRNVSESEEEQTQRMGRNRRIYDSEESNRSVAEKTTNRRRNSTSTMSSALSLAESAVPAEPTRGRNRIAQQRRKAAQREIESEEPTEDMEMGGRKLRNMRVNEWAEEQRTMARQREDESAESVLSAADDELVNAKFAHEKMPETILLGFPLPPSPSGTFPAQFAAHDFSNSSNVMDYRGQTQNEADEGRVQEVAISGEFFCGRTKRFHPAAVYLREFFWESGIRDRWETVKHPKWVKRIVGLYALRPSFGSFTFKIVRPTASYQVHTGEENEPKINRKSRRRWRRGGIRLLGKRRRLGKKTTPKGNGEGGEWPVLETEHSQFELVFDRGTCDNAHNYEAETESSNSLFDDLCLSEFARKPDWQDRKWRKEMNAERKCSPEIMDKQNDRICVQRVGEVISEAEFVEKSMGPIRVDKCTGGEEDVPTKASKRARGDKPRTGRSSRRFWRKV